MLKKNLLYNALLAVSQLIFPLITFPYSSRILGPEGIGSVNFVDSFTQYFILFSALGIPLYGIREISKQKNNKEGRNQIFSEILMIHIISATIFSIIYLVIALSIPRLSIHLDLVAVGILIIVFGVFSVEWLFQGLEEFAFITIRSLIVRCCSIVFLFVFLKADSPPIIYYCVLASGAIINGLANLFFIRNLVHYRFINLNLIKHLKPLLLIFGSIVAVSVYILMDNVILGFIKDERAVGIYATALRIVRIPLALVGAINAVIIPQVSRAFDAGDFNEIRSLIDKSYHLLCIIGIPIVCGLFVASTFLIHLFGGPKFEDSILPLQIMAPLVFLNGMGYIICMQVLAPLGKEKQLFRAYLVAMVFSIPVNIFLVNHFSFNGAAVGIMLTELLATGLCYYFLTLTIKIDFNKRILLQSVLGAVFFFPIAYLLRHILSGYILTEVSVILACMVFYAMYVWFFIKNNHIQGIKQKIFTAIQLNHD
jgi:O-antigen/teichoic acid export membrane protein